MTLPNSNINCTIRLATPLHCLQFYMLILLQLDISQFVGMGTLLNKMVYIKRRHIIIIPLYIIYTYIYIYMYIYIYIYYIIAHPTLTYHITLLNASLHKKCIHLNVYVRNISSLLKTEILYLTQIFTKVVLK